MARKYNRSVYGCRNSGNSYKSMLHEYLDNKEDKKLKALNTKK